MDFGLLNGVLDAFDTATGTWVATLQPLALSLFAALGTIEFIWTFVRASISARVSGADLFELGFRKLLYLAFLNWLILKCPAAFGLIIATFQKAGGQAAGITALRPSAYLNTGVALSMHIWSGWNAAGFFFDPFGRELAVYGSLACIAIFGLMATSLMVTLIESYIIISGGAQLLLGFAASRWTFPLAEGGVTAVFRIAVKLLVTYLVTGVIASLTFQWAATLRTSSFVDVFQFLTFLGTAFTAAILQWTLPSRLTNYLVPPSFHIRLSPVAGDN
ncbi:MAG TPA: type IV secretion system protein [Thermoanaerobaculia bacterium]|jgi:type IV secretion system protein TrbL|nr:type IV secretion system protein [Thermoanaerobaculia bacterium]